VQHWIQETLSANTLGPAVLPAAFLLGILGALASCCTLPVLGAVAGYAGTLSRGPGRKRLLLVGLCFMVGTILSLAAIGAVTGLVGRIAGASLGRYWRVIAGLVMVLFGLSSLGVLRLRTPKIDPGSWTLGSGPAGAILFGLAVGGATTACSLCCNPLLPAAVGAAVLRGASLMGGLMLGVFALGYSLPLAAGLVGIGFGMSRLGSAAQRVVPVVSAGVGVLLIALGFFMLATA
jgi:cytochrome c biogenesis protein CcdA